MKNNFAQRQSARQGFAFQTRLAALLEMPEREYAELISEIEADPLFLKLKYAQDSPERAIRSRRLKQTDLSRRFFELKEDIAVQSESGGGEVEKLLENKEKLVSAIQEMGEEDFKRYFIYNEDELSLGEIAEHCSITSAEAKEILWLVNTVDIYNEFFTPSKTPLGQGGYYNKVAVLEKTACGDFAVLFNSAHWARGLYEVDHEKIERMVSAGKITKDEHKRLKILLSKIEFINLRKSLMHTVISKIMEKQSDYLQSGGERAPVPFLQSELAKDINVHPSLVSRATAGRSIETPWGEEKPLKSFFFSAKPKQREAVFRHIEDIMKDEEIKIQKGEMIKPFSDKAISLLLRDKYAVTISQRTVAKYRNSMKLPGAFYRKSK